MRSVRLEGVMMQAVAVVVVGALRADVGLLVIMGELANSANGTASVMQIKSEVV
jgi:hypothetical protein